MLRCIKKYFVLNPFVKGNIELSIIIITGILSYVFNFMIIKLFPVINIIGGVLVIASFLFHIYCEKSHREAHKSTGNIQKLVTYGIYSKMRHPIYLSIIVIYVGFSLFFNSWLSLIIAILFSATWFFSAIQEEKGLIEIFGQEYIDYKSKTKWRIIPGIF